MIALQLLRDFFPDFLQQSVFGRKAFVDSTKLVFTLLQNPKFNRELTYVLLDVVLLDVFPDVFPGGTNQDR